jgi:hypothetical protein
MSGQLVGKENEMSLSTRLANLEAALRGRDGGKLEEPLIFWLHQWAEAEGCPVAFQPWEVEELSPRFEAMALDNLVAAGKIRECDRQRVRFMRRVLAYPPQREGEVDKYAHVRPLLRQWQERQAGKTDGRV